MGTLSNKDQGISGHVYSVDENTVYLKNFTFSGTGSGTYSLAYYFLFFPSPDAIFKNIFLYLLPSNSVAIFVYAGTLGEDGGYTKTGFPLRNIKGS